MIPGPKMMWMFGELGYDYSPNACSNGSTTCGSTDPKPIRWDYFTQPNRLALYNVYSKLLNLRNVPAYLSTFTTGSVNKNLSGAIKWMSVYGTPLQVMVYGNFDVQQQTGTVSFPGTGLWYNLFTGKDTTVLTTSLSNVTLQPGEYRVFVNIAAALPVTLISFTGTKSANGNLLTWQVANELNLSHYELEKSTDGQNFNLVANIQATGSQFYSYTDNDQDNAPVDYYRLKSVDIDGNFNYSGIILIKSNANSWNATINPNPVANNIKLQIASPVTDKAAISITDISGRQLYRNSIVIHQGTNSFEINNDGSFVNGTYFISIFSTQKTQTIKFICNQ
jgi:hypothetical protein